MTAFQVDTAGNLIQITDPDGTIRRFEYDSVHRMTAEIDKRGAHEQVFYDRTGRVERVVRRDGTEVLYKTVQRADVTLGEPALNLSTRTPASTDVTTDALMIEPSGNVIRLQLDQSAQTVAARDSVGPSPTVRRNQDNLVTNITDARGNRTVFRYDNRGNLISQFDSISGSEKPPLPTRIVRTTTGNDAIVGTAADLNGDGLPDLALASVNDQSLLIHFSRGFDSVGAVIYDDPEEFSIAASPQGIVAFDVNGDGNLDLAAVSLDDNVVSVLLGDGVGGFQSTMNFPTGDQPSALVVGDFDGDGFDDLLVGNRGGNSLSILLADGAGGMRDQMVAPLGFHFQDIAVGDVDLDGTLDVVGARFSGNAAVVLLGRGDGSFDHPQSFVVDAGPFGVALGDVNGDGFPDVVTANLNADTITVLAGDGTGAFPTRTEIATGDQPLAVRIADVSGGGSPDVVVHSGFGDLIVHQGEAALVADPSIPGRNGRKFELVDLNADGRLDAVTYQFGSVLQHMAKDGGTF